MLDGFIDIKDSFDHWLFIMRNDCDPTTINILFISLGWWHYYDNKSQNFVDIIEKFVVY